MPLDEYRRKRKFQQTPEPGPESSAAESAPTGSHFVVQMHHASRLHFDFRLEMEGVLKSWAVPKGPTLDPEQKRLAMMTEDHPLAYMTFEGIIPAGNYGGGTVMVWDIGTFEPVFGYKHQAADALAMLQAGDLKFRLHGQKLQGEFALVHMKARRPGSKGNEWLMIKKKDEYADSAWTVEQADRSALTGRTLSEIAADRGSATWGVEKVPQAARKAAERTIVQMGPDISAVTGAKRAPIPAKIEPMLAKIAQTPPQGADWLQEIKWDGIRALAFIENGKLKLVSRNQNDVTKHYPDLSELPKQVRAASAILDGEIVCLEPSGRPSFEMLQQRMNLRTPKPEVVANNPVIYYAFDLLYADDFDLRQVPLEKRKELLRALLRPSEGPEERARFSDHHVGDGNMLFELAAQLGLEGIMAKRRLSTYEGRRSDEWVKIKTAQTQECVVLGWTAPAGARKYFGSLALGVTREGKLAFAGNAGSGFDEKSQKEVFRQLEALPAVKMPFKTIPDGNKTTHWVKPELMANIRFTEWTNEKRMRAPVFLSLRKNVPEPEAPPPLFSKRTGEETVTVDGQRMRIQNLDKIFFPRDGYTKADTIEYYFRIAPYLLPHMTGKPVVMKRYPDGAEKPFFFQKDAGKAMPGWIRKLLIEDTQFVMCDNRATLVYLAQLGCIDHNLWQSSEATLESPDFILFDLDPGDRCPVTTLVEAAQSLHEAFGQLGLAAYPKTSGAAGMHIYVPLEPVYSYEQARSMAEVICHVVEHRHPKLMTHERSLGKRPQDRVYLDYMQIGLGKTVPPPYSLRPQPGATLSTPLEWSEVRAGLDPRAFTIRTIWSRLAEKGDLFEATLKRRQRLEAAMEKLEGLAER
jgi:bifunctional non-homologous end joining protein LigD